MFDSPVLRGTAAVVAAALIHLASSFQPGSDYDTYKTTNLYNCTGHVPLSNVTVPNAADTLPQLEPSAGQGWEQWSLFLHGTFPMVLKWNQGNPSSSVPSPAHFDLLMDVNGTIVQGTVTGDLSYTNGEHVKQIAIGENSVAWGSDTLWYNVSANIDGYHLELDSLAATLDAFHPNVAFYNGLLDRSGDWFGSVPLLRGHVLGNLCTPSGQNITVSGLSVMRHMFSENPLPSYINKYAGGTIWGYSKTFYDSHIFYQTEAIDGTVHEAAFLGRALPIPGQQDGFSAAWATYAVTDDSNLYKLSIDDVTKELHASFSGCQSTSEVPYLFNVNATTLLGEFTDLGGGKTSYYTLVNGSTSASFNGSVTHGAISGIFEEYQAPSTNGGKGC